MPKNIYFSLIQAQYFHKY